MWAQQGILNSILDAFGSAVSSWIFSLHPIATRLFLLLAAIEITWSCLRFLLSNRDQGVVGLIELLFLKTIYLSFVFYLLQNAPTLLATIISSFQKAGSAASGVDALHPSAFLSTGVSVAASYAGKLNLLGLLIDPFTTAIAVGGIFAILFSFAFMAGIVLVAIVESYLAIGSTLLLLAFAASRWTCRLAEVALLYVIRVGLKLYLLYLVAGIVLSLAQQWANLILLSDDFLGVVNYFTYIGTVAVLAMLLWTIPHHASRLVPPTITLGLSPAVGDN
jgi:type IV secretion system protein TrbL